MLDTRIVLSGPWVATMLIHLWGDVLRMLAGHVTPGMLNEDTPGTQGIWMMVAAIMLIPIVMIVLSLTLPYPVARWTNIVVAIVAFVFNLFGLSYRAPTTISSSRSASSSTRW